MDKELHNIHTRILEQHANSKNNNMEEVLEALERLKNAPDFMGGTVEYRFNSNSQVPLLKDYELIKQAITELKTIKETESSELTLKDLVSKHIINPNSVVDVYEQDKNNPHYSNRIFAGMAWEMEKEEIGNRKLKYIFSAVAETISESDRICIEVEVWR